MTQSDKIKAFVSLLLFVAAVFFFTANVEVDKSDVATGVADHLTAGADETE